MDFRRVVVSGLAAGIAAFLVGTVLYMNPLVSGIYSRYSSWPGYRSMDTFGGLGYWSVLMLIGGLFSTVLLAFLYSYAERGIEMAPAWKKGLFFGFLLWLVYKVPTSYYTWLMYSLPDIQNIIETFNGLVGGIVAGIVLALVYERMK